MMNRRFCSNPLCTHSRLGWQLLSSGYSVEGEWHCSIPCLRRAVRLLVRHCLLRPNEPSLPTLRKTRIGAILVSRRLITHNQLEAALEKQRREGKLLGKCLRQMQYISCRDLTIALSEQQGLPWMEDITPSVSDRVLNFIPKKLCQVFKVFAVGYRSQSQALMVALGGPLEQRLIPLLRKMLECDVYAFVSDDEKVSQLIERYVEPRPDDDRYEAYSVEQDPESITQSILDFGSSFGSRRILIDSFKDTLWVRFGMKQNFRNLFLEF